ncbi:MAG: carbamoyl-phosphate synthase large subunit [Halanaerobiales bacterium]|nr:carbamoyl-phosphate synthase large subunit [Halanaerobiales bacterium]
MPLRKDINKVLVIGSGPIIIGQAAEFDYSGTQACKALKEEGLEVVLINSNPATIMTDSNIADKVYLEPLTLSYVSKIIALEKPDGLLPTLGGQTGLNLAVELAESGILKKYDVKLLGTNLEAIKRAEDRKLFRELLQELGEPVIESEIVNNIEQSLEFIERVGFPVIIRPAYTLGGSGGGIAYNKEQFLATVELGLKRSRISQVILEKSVSGWKEIEYEVIRDGNDNCITICNMENIDPVGVHTGDSIVVAPSQTLTDKEYHLLRSVSLKIIRALKIEGGCNIQFALNPESDEYYIIEVNPRVSRSSALASKATGYPIAQVSAKIALGLHLDEIKNEVTGRTYACFEPALDYVVTKIPRWPFDKFSQGNRRLGTQMKATGEVMAIGRNFAESFLKAIESLDLKLPAIDKVVDREQLKERIQQAEDNRIFLIIQALFNNISPEEIHHWTGIDLFYLYKLAEIAEMTANLLEKRAEITANDYLLLKKAKKLGFSDRMLAHYLEMTPADVRTLRLKAGMKPVFKMVDTCASEFAAETPYYYSTYEEEDEVELREGRKILVVGSGPIRIGQGIEFDYSSVHAVKALQEEGIEAIIVNNNPETVSTDFDTADKLYFEPLTEEYVLNIIDREGIKGVILQFGGQTAINLAEPLTRAGVDILGTDLDSINLAEDRKLFNRLLTSEGIPTPVGYTAYNLEEALAFTEKVGYPALVRPSFVLGGRGMEIVSNERELKLYLEEAVKISPQHPVLIDRYIFGKEVEVDAIADGEEVLIPGIMEHIERAGVHSGDSMAVYPAQSLSKRVTEQLVIYTRKIVSSMRIKGLINIQFVIDEVGNIYVLEVNPRASRTVPILSKVTGIPMVNWAVKIMLGKKLTDLTEYKGLLPPSDLISVKVPVFSFDKLLGVDIHLTPEMKSTGEVLGTDRTLEGAVYKGLLSANFNLPDGSNILFSLADRDKNEGLELAREFSRLGYSILATANTGKFFRDNGVTVKEIIRSFKEINKNEVKMLINTPTRGKVAGREGFQLRRTAVEFNIPCYTSLDTVKVVLRVLQEKKNGKKIKVYSLDQYNNKNF